MKIFIYILIIVSCVNCAQQSLLSGGEKDVDPPALLNEKTKPVNHTVFFNSSTILLEFNEYIKLKNKKKSFFVNPPIEKITLEEKGKQILIHIEEPLLENTTYTFNFGNSVEDITENNPHRDFKYVISTGAFIDSNYYKGVVYDAFNKTPVENSLLFLYDEFIDSFPTKKIPKYIGFSNEKGKYRLDYLKKGSYYVLAINDKNNNNVFDIKSEKMAFDQEKIHSVVSSDSAKADTLLLFHHDPQLSILEKTYVPPGKFIILFNKKTESSQINVQDHDIIIQKSLKPSDSLIFWLKKLTTGPVNIKIENIKESFSDEITINTFSSKSKDTAFHFKERNLNSLKPGKPLQLQFYHPIKSVDTSKIHLFSDSIKLDMNYSIQKNNWFLNIPKSANQELELLADPGAFTSIYGYKNDSIQLLFKKKSDASFGNILLNISNKKGTEFIVHLLSKDAIIRSYSGLNGHLSDSIYLCNPGVYQLRLIEDLNRDGKWTTGDINKKLQPEPVYYYNESIEVRSGWDMDIQWVIQ